MGIPIIPVEQVGQPGHIHNQKYFLSDAGRRLLLDTYDGRTETVDMLTKHLQVPRWCVRRWAVQLGLSQPRKTAWTPEEERYLEANLHHMSVGRIAKKLGRTKVAVQRKAASLGISKLGEGYTIHSLADALGCARQTVTLWVERGWLKGKRRQTERPDNDIWYFSDAAVRKFIMQHPHEVDPRRADWLWLVDVLAGGIGELPGHRGESE